MIHRLKKIIGARDIHDTDAITKISLYRRGLFPP